MQFEKDIEARVQTVKNDEDWRVEYINWNVAQMDAELAGQEKGEAIGMLRGRAEGERHKALETARNFLKMGLSVEQVALGTGLSVAEVTAQERGTPGKKAVHSQSL